MTRLYDAQRNAALLWSNDGTPPPPGDVWDRLDALLAHSAVDGRSGDERNAWRGGDEDETGPEPRAADLRDRSIAVVRQVRRHLARNFCKAGKPAPEIAVYFESDLTPMLVGALAVKIMDLNNMLIGNLDVAACCAFLVLKNGLERFCDETP